MVYLDYCIMKQGYLGTEGLMRELLDRKEEAFTRTQPNAIRYDGQKVISSVSDRSAVEDYIMAAEKIDAQIAEVKSILADRLSLLLQKENELRKSADVNDRIYVLRFLEQKDVRYIARKLNYTKNTIYWRIARMEDNLENIGIKLQ